MSARPSIEADSDRRTLYGDALERLRVPALDALLLHRTSDLASPHLGPALTVLRAGRDAGELGRIGVSIYDRADLERAIERIPDLGVIQLPGSAVDRRLLDDPLVRDLHDRGVQIQVRSVFLQGLLLLPSEQLPPAFSGLGPFADAIRAEDPAPDAVLGVLLAAVRDAPAVDAVVVGATTPEELAAICRAWRAAPGAQRVAYPEVPAALLDPRRWP